MIRFIATLLLLAAWGMAPAQAQQWVEYRSESGSYRIEFPSAPQIETEDIASGGGPLRTTTAESVVEGEAVFSASESIIPPNLDIDPNVELNGARDGLITTSKARLRLERRLSIGGTPARRLVMDTANDTATVALIVCGRDRMYTAIATVRRGQEGSEKVERFFKSFTLLPR